MTQGSPPTGNDGTAFAEQLRRYRLRAGLSQEALAEKVGLAPVTIGALERGVRRRPYPHTRQVLADALGLVGSERADFIAQPSAEAEPATPATNLPLPRTPIIGRAGEIGALRELIRRDDVRLVTLTGSGGVGKTRLALDVARTLEEDFSGGIWFVQLAPVTEPALLPQALGNALGLQDTPGVPLVDTIRHQLGRQPSLLVLDNCEHLVEPCAALADQLLTACPGLRILATSREPLQITGEHRWRVPLLAAPDLEDPTGALRDFDLSRYPAVELFVVRAKAVVASFELTSENAPTVARICSRLGGLPLAIELAAARIGVLTPSQILTKLDDALHLLTHGSSVTPTRQQSMRATLDWSYQLLDAGEQATIIRLAVFAGRFDLDAAETVCAALDPPREDVLDLLASLVDKSLVLVEEDRTATVARYHLLEPVRQYMLDHLLASGESKEVRDRHLAHYLALAESIAPALHGPDQLNWLDRLDDERDNLRAALSWAQESAASNLGRRLAVALAPYWEDRGYLSEGRHWLAAMLNLPVAEPDVRDVAHLRAQVLLAAGRLAQWQTDLQAAEDLLNESLALARSLDDHLTVAEALVYLGTVRRRQGDFEASRAVLEESLKLYESLDDRSGRALAMLTLGVTLRQLQMLDRSASLIEGSLQRFEQTGDLRWTAMAHTMLGATGFARGDVDQSMRHTLAGLAEHQRIGDQTLAVLGLIVLIEMLAMQQRAVEATRAVGLLTRLSETLNMAIDPNDESGFEMILSSLRCRLGPEEFDRIQAEGAALTLDQLLEELVE